MRENRDAWLDLLLSPSIEGGYSNLGWDPETNLGITKATYEAWLDRSVTTEDMKALTPQVSREIAVAMYWNVVKGDSMPGGLDLYLADFAFNSGPETAVKKLQEIVGVKVDGVVGEKTLAACRAVSDTRDLINALHEARMTYLRGLPKWGKAGLGWTRRCAKMRDAALALVRSNVIEAKAPQAAAKGAGLAAIVAALVAALPLIFDQAKAAHDAASAGEWTVVASAIAVAAGAVLGGLNRYLQHQAAAR